MCVHEPTICFSPVPLQTCGPADHGLAETMGMIVSAAQRFFPSAASVAKALFRDGSRVSLCVSFLLCSLCGAWGLL